MIHRLLLLSLLSFSVVVVRAAPASLDADTLLKNCEEAQSLNRQFKALKVTDPCQDGEEACIKDTIAKCRGTKWETSRGKCSKSQLCFALPSVSKEGTSITCTSEKSALSLIDAGGAKGGIFGNQTPEGGSNDEDSTRGVSTASASYGTSPSSSSIIPQPTSAAPEKPSATSVYSNPDEADDATSSRTPCTMQQPTTSPEPIATSSPDSSEDPYNPSSAKPTVPVSAASPSQYSPTASPTESSLPDATPDRVTVTITLSQATTLAAQTRTIPLAEASALISSILADGGKTAAPTPAPYGTSPTASTAALSTAETVAPSVPISPSPYATSISTTSTPELDQGGYGGY